MSITVPKKRQLTEVTKLLQFEAAHLLTGHAGLCKNLHGHSYKLELTFASAIPNAQFMVMDFSEVKRIGEKLLSILDHSFMFNMAAKPDSLEMQIANLVQLYGGRLAAFSGPVTAENMVHECYKLIREYMYDQGYDDIPNAPQITRIRLWETASSYAEVHYEYVDTTC